MMSIITPRITERIVTRTASLRAGDSFAHGDVLTSWAWGDLAEWLTPGLSLKWTPGAWLVVRR